MNKRTMTSAEYEAELKRLKDQNGDLNVRLLQATAKAAPTQEKRTDLHIASVAARWISEGRPHVSDCEIVGAGICTCTFWIGEHLKDCTPFIGDDPLTCADLPCEQTKDGLHRYYNESKDCHCCGARWHE